MIIRAVYRDSANNRFIGIVERTSDGWRIQSEHGPRTIDYYVQEKTAVGGMLEFVDYEIYLQQALRPADVIPFINSVRATLPWPTKPSNPPSEQTDDDPRLHLGERLGNEDPLQQLQRVYAEQEIAAHRKARLESRNRAQSATVDPRTAQQAQQARQARNDSAALMRPRTKGDK